MLAAIVFGQRLAQAYLGQAGAVQWRRVEVADALLPGGMTVAAGSSSGMLGNMLPSGAEPKPSGPLISLSLMLMIPPRLRSRGLCLPSFLPYLHQAFRLDTASDRRPVVPRQMPGIPQVATFDRTYA
jgi:hypothetical protein